MAHTELEVAASAYLGASLNMGPQNEARYTKFLIGTRIKGPLIFGSPHL